jgi:hypothetical protein
VTSPRWKIVVASSTKAHRFDRSINLNPFRGRIKQVHATAHHALCNVERGRVHCRLARRLH